MLAVVNREDFGIFIKPERLQRVDHIFPRYSFSFLALAPLHRLAGDEADELRDAGLDALLRRLADLGFAVQRVFHYPPDVGDGKVDCVEWVVQRCSDHGGVDVVVQVGVFERVGDAV